jgi:hypothetical protein
VVPRVLRGIRGRWVIKDRKVLRVRERKVHKVLKVPRVLVLKDLRAQQDPREPKVHKVLRVRRV